MDTAHFYKSLTESIKLLSFPYEVQEKYFEEFTDKPFEIFDTFYNAFLLLPQIVESELLSYTAIANILRTKNVIDLTSGTPGLIGLEIEQFRSHPEWNHLREVAKKTLKSMGEPLEEPNPEYI